MKPIIRSLVLAIALAALLPAAAHASPNQFSIMMDDDLLVYRDDTTAAKSLTQMQQLGVDVVRVTLLWEVAARDARPSKAEIKKLKDGGARERARKQAARFKATDPRTYPKRNWDRYDNLVKAAQDRGIRVYFNITGPGPAWGHTKPPKALSRFRRTWKPRASAFKAFVTAVGKRYDGTYRDENASRGVIPRVSFWSLWNEPNQGGWLTPQWETVGGEQVPTSPAIFRKLHQAGYNGLVATGHRKDNDIILLAETAPLGSDNPSEKSPMRPGLFLRELACVKADLTPYDGAEAEQRSCDELVSKGGVQATGYAHHPYTKNVSPLQRDPDPDSMTMANISELGTLLDSLSAATGGAMPANLPLFMTEFGFETNPPDPFSGVAPALQAKYNTIGEFQAWQNPRVASQAQFLLFDGAPVRSKPKNSKPYWFTYQSGLFFRNALPKPAAGGYIMPFLATFTGVEEATGNPVFSFWGQARFLQNGKAQDVHVQWRAKDGSIGWTTVGDPVAIDFRGYYTAARVAPAPVPGEWRGAILTADGTAASSSLGADGT